MEPGQPFVEFSIPPDPAYVRVARLASGDMAERAGFSIDELDDVRLAVDELCAYLIGARGAALQLRIQALDRTLYIEGRATCAETHVAPSKLSEALLGALVDSCTFGAQDHEVTFRMTKSARDGA